MKTSTKLYLTLLLLLSVNSAFAQIAKVVDTPGGTVISTIGGNEIPHSTAVLDIRSTNKGVLFPRMSTANRDVISVPQAGLLIYNTSTNQFNYHNGSSWQAAFFGNQWGVTGDILHHTGKVGIGTSIMSNSSSFLTVRGNLGLGYFEGMYIDGSSSTTKPFYGYAVDGVPKAYHYFDGGNSKWHLNVGAGKITVLSTGLVGIGTENPSYKLDVVGSIHATSNAYIDDAAGISGILTVDGNITGYNNLSIEGTATVNNGKGVAYNANSANNLRMYKFTTQYFHVTLPAHGAMMTTVTFGGGFSSAPMVVVGDIEREGGDLGELDRVILVLSGCSLNTTTGNTTCNARLINTDNASLDYNISWNCMAIGY